MNKLAALILNKNTDPEAYRAYMDDAPPAEELLISRTAKECLIDASKRPIPGMLFTHFWYEGELCILFADTNIGKSILAVQIADRISRGESDHIFRVETPSQCVLYLDFELSDKQFEKRYSDEYWNHYDFHPHLRRLEINTNYENTVNFEAELEAAIETHIMRSGARVMVVDNITYLKTQTTESAKDAIPLMKMLTKLKKKYGMSILALAHTPKRDHSKEITVNDLAGSKHISNFADSIFAIGQSHKDAGIRYIKQIKARASEKFYDSDYVLLCRIEKHINFLGFTHCGFDKEWEHVKRYESKEDQSREAEETVIAAYKENPGQSMREISRVTDVHDKRVKRILLKHGLIKE